jgi:hypothetical protein
MIRRLRRRRMLAPVLFGALVTGGCQLLGTDTAPLTPPQTFGDKAPETGAQMQKTGPFAGPNNGTPADQTAMLGTPRPGQAPRRHESPASAFEPEAKEATNVDYIPPATASPYNRATTVSSTARAPSRPDPTLPTGRVVTLTPGEFRVERDADVTLKCNSGDPDAKKLETRVQQLEHRLEQRDRIVRESGTEIQAANEELRKTVAHVEALRNEVHEMRARLGNRDKEDIESLQLTIKALEKLLAEEGATGDGPRK